MRQTQFIPIDGPPPEPVLPRGELHSAELWRGTSGKWYFYCDSQWYERAVSEVPMGELRGVMEELDSYIRKHKEAKEKA